MSKKQVSIRLFIEGGKVVRGEFKDIGDEAEKTGRRVGKGMSEGERALASFMSRAKIVAAAGAAALSGLGAMVVDRGLEMIDNQAKLAQSLDTTVASMQVLERAGELAGVAMSGVEQATKDMHRRLSQAAAGGGPAVDALNRLGLSADALMNMPLDERIAAISDAMEKFIPEAEKAAVAGQIFGEEGSIAMGRLDTAKLKQAREELEKYGLLISDVDAAGVERANDALSKLSTIWVGMGNSLAAKVAPTLERVANALADSLGPEGTLGRAISFLGENIERIFAYAASFAAFMGGKWVFGMARAALSVKGLSRALVLFKGALIATGVGALIVGAGELVLMFTRLVQGAGGFGNALSILKDLGVEVWERIKWGAASVGSRMEAMWQYFKVVGLEALQGSMDGVTNFANNVINTFEGTKDSIAAIWNQLPDLLGSIIFSAANGIVNGIESLLNSIIARINNFTSKVNWVTDKLPDWAQAEWMEIGEIGDIKLGDIDNPLEGAFGDTATAVKEAFKAAFSDDFFDGVDLGFSSKILEASLAGNSAMEWASRYADLMKAPVAAWDKLVATIKKAGEDGEVTINEATDAVKAYEDALATAAGSTEKEGDKIFKGWEAVTEKLKDYVKGAQDWGNNLGDVFVRAFGRAESAFDTFLDGGKVSMKDFVASIARDLAMLSFRQNIMAPVANWLGLALGGGAGAGVLASVHHGGGGVGFGGSSRMVPAGVFANAPRMHNGGWAGLRPDEVPIIAERGERILSRREVAAGTGLGGGVVGLRIYLDDQANLKGVIEGVTGPVTAEVVHGALEAYDSEVLPGRVDQINRNPGMIG